MSRTQLPRPPDLRAWFHTLPDVLLFVEVDFGRVAEVNRVGGAWGWSRYELVGKPVGELFPELDGAALLGSSFGPAETTLLGNQGRIPVELKVATVAAERGWRLAIVREIGDRTEARAELTRLHAEIVEANRFLDAVVENIPDMIFVKRASDHQFIRFNRAGEELLGWSRTELLGKTDHDFYPKEEADFFHAKDDETFVKGVLVDIPEEPITTKAHGARWLHTRKVPVYDEEKKPLYLLGISEDITERKAAEERAHALERELAAVVTHAHDAVVTWTPEGRITSLNPAAEALYGLKTTDVGSPIEQLVPESSRAAFARACARVLVGDKLPPVEVPRLRLGFEIEVEERLFRIGGPNGDRLASIARDASELGRLRRAAEILVAGTTPAPKTGPTRMQRFVEEAIAVAEDSVATVLILGETGVGKSWVARRIHARSPRADRPFLEVNCASLGAELVESELFGHERGAFTGAVSQKRGIVEAADGGTLFLDEVGELPLPVQAQLLTFLDSKSFRRVGGMRTLTADVRLVAATNKELEAAVADGEFRADLFYRLSVFPLEVPPLRERKDDIPELARTLLSELAARQGRPVEIEPTALDLLLRYPWPGNVRELRNALERAVILSRGRPIRPEHLPLAPAATSRARSKILDDVEREHILGVLEEVAGNRTRAAEVLGISRSTLKRKLAELRVGEDG
jgi:PAS domain S-box-containing protein